MSKSNNPLIDFLRSCGSLVEAFQNACTQCGSDIAVTLNGRSLSYEELDRMSSSIAAELQHNGAGAGDLIALVSHRSIEMVAAMLAIWKVGGAYLPLDAHYPLARILQTLEDAGPSLVITDTAIEVPSATKIISLASAVTSSACFKPVASRSRESLAYVIYTSGSTGKPKGVMIGDHSLLRLVTAIDPWFNFRQGDTWTMFHSHAFDFSVFEMWNCLLTGGRLVIVPYETCRNPEALYTLLRNENVAVFSQTPSALQLFFSAEGEQPFNLPALRYIVLGGEALNFRSLNRWFDRHGDSQPQIINMYGITETTVHSTYRRVLQADALRENDSLIGVPIPDMRVHILDDDGNETTEGEMYWSGDGVAKGYWKMPELTAERFMPNPFGSGKLYRSGDIAKRREDGELVYMGRRDRQVKLRGFRIELGEIEAILQQHGSVDQVRVEAVQHPHTGPALAAYVVAHGFDEKALSAYATQNLPEQMRPTYYVPLSAIPLTINGKIDRAALPLPWTIKTAPTVAAATETEATVARVWKKVLGLHDLPDVTLSFFEAGGNSLLIQSLRIELERELEIPVEVLTLFRFPTVRSFAESLSRAKSAPAVVSKPVFRPLRRPAKEVMQ